MNDLAGRFTLGTEHNLRSINFDDQELSPTKLGNTMFLLIVSKFGYLSNIISRNCKDDDNVVSRIKTAENDFGTLR